MFSSSKTDKFYTRWQAILQLPNGKKFKCKTTAVSHACVYLEVPVSITPKTQVVTSLYVDPKQNITLEIIGEVKTCFLSAEGDNFIVNVGLENINSESKKYISDYLNLLGRSKPRLGNQIY